MQVYYMPVYTVSDLLRTRGELAKKLDVAIACKLIAHSIAPEKDPYKLGEEELDLLELLGGRFEEPVELPTGDGPKRRKMVESLQAVIQRRYQEEMRRICVAGSVNGNGGGGGGQTSRTSMAASERPSEPGLQNRPALSLVQLETAGKRINTEANAEAEAKAAEVEAEAEAGAGAEAEAEAEAGAEAEAEAVAPVEVEAMAESACKKEESNAKAGNGKAAADKGPPARQSARAESFARWMREVRENELSMFF